jgi:hypothetical protein
MVIGSVELTSGVAIAPEEIGVALGCGEALGAAWQAETNSKSKTHRIGIDFFMITSLKKITQLGNRLGYFGDRIIKPTS